VADSAGRGHLSPRARRYLIEIYLAAGSPEAALAASRAGDPGAASFVEKFKATKGTAKSIGFYDLALLTDLAQLYRELARLRLSQAAADPRMKPSAEILSRRGAQRPGRERRGCAAVQAFLARPQGAGQFRERAARGRR